MEDRIFEVAEVKTVESLAVRIRTTVRNTQKIMLDAAISIGQDLIEAKELVEHGEWKEWVENTVGFSYESAKKYMQISREYGDFSKRELITDLSYTKALKLLAVPDEDREEFIENNDVEGMTVKELEEKIKAISEEKAVSDEQIEKLGDELVAAEGDKLMYRDQVVELEKKIAALEATGADAEDGISEDAQREIEKAKEDLTKAEKKAETAGKKAEKLQADLDQLKASQEKAIQDAKAAAIEEGKQLGKKENEEDLLKQKEIADEAVKLKQEAEKKLAASANKDLMRMAFLTEQLQKIFNEAVEALEDIEVNDQEQGGKLRGGLYAILGQMQERL